MMTSTSQSLEPNRHICVVLAIAALLLVLPVHTAWATKYAQPERHDEYSWNGQYVLDIDPDTELHTVYAVNDRQTPLWSFSQSVWHFPFLVSDDGKVVATVAWNHIKAADVDNAIGVTFWNASGPFHSVALKDLCDNPPQTHSVGGGPVGDFWRTWYYTVENHGDRVTLTTTRNVAYEFRYADGAQLSSKRVPARSRTGSREWVVNLPVALLTLLGFYIVLRIWWRRREAELAESDHP